MKFALAIIPAFLALSAFGSPIELDARQKLLSCDFEKCLEAVAPQIIPIRTCAATIKNLANIEEAQSKGKPPRKEDLMGLATNGRKCIADANDLHIKPPPICELLFINPVFCLPA
ncbi:hypothetical protein Agabi119p4_5251 [Agaricus bisporus var. burnettii]|uniref:Uncharacterized protein n=1 Tax=Agaricus bisporus var. burnettii TaxID=192524 RepID=A0A8H7F515_AGABI|nr:hypothetical protein Agabi119p4_5251 [Agaricus bisporus var. burnettii]